MELLVAGTPRAHGEQFPFRYQGFATGRSRDGGFPGRPDGRVRAERTDGRRRGVGRSGHTVLAATGVGRPATRRLPSTGRLQSLDADNLLRRDGLAARAHGVESGADEAAPPYPEIHRDRRAGCIRGGNSIGPRPAACLETM